jgi:hypothetical protein
MFKVEDVKDKLNVVKKDNEYSQNESNNADKIIKNYFFKIFDTHFLNFVNHRKQRDYSIFIEAVKLIIEKGKFSKDVVKDNNLTAFFTISGSKLSFLDDILPMNKNEDVLNIEKETEILKALLKFYNDNINTYFNGEVDINLISKAKKIKELNDNKMLERISTNDEFCGKILKKLPSLKNYDFIKDSKIFYDYISQEIKLIADRTNKF